MDMNNNTLQSNPYKTHSKGRGLFSFILVVIYFLTIFFAYQNTLQAKDPDSYSPYADNAQNIFYYVSPYISGKCIYYDALELPPEGEEIRVMYNLLDDADKRVYNLFLDLVKNRDGDNYTNGIIIERKQLEALDPNHFWKIYDAMLYDYPEYFFLISTPQIISCQSITTANYKTFIYKMEAETFGEAAQIEAFNAATDEFLSDIDLGLSPEEIELAIHDKLISLVSYNFDLLEKTKSDNSIHDLGQSAYGALVCDSSGTPNRALCGGYAFAFEHLCQIAGIPCSIITGNASNITDDLSGLSENSHAWNVVNLNGNWYEVDVTWDDYEYKESMDLSFYEALQNDEEQFYNLLHHFYNRTTDEMKYLIAENDIVFEIEGYLPFSIREDTSHIRYTKYLDDPSDSDAFRNRLIPVAF